MITVAEINDIERLSGLRLLWRSLWGQTRNTSLFESFEWLENYWRHFGKDKKLRTLVVAVAGKPIGIVPLVVKLVPSRLGPVRALMYPLDSWGAFYGPIGPSRSATLLAALRHLHQTRRDWDMIDLGYVDLQRTDRGRTQNALRSAGLQSCRRVWQQTARVDTMATWESYWASRSNACRQEYEFAEETLSQIGTVTFERYRPRGMMYGDTDRRRDLFNTFEEMFVTDQRAESRRRQNGSIEKGARFLRDMHGAAVDAGGLDLNVLSLNSKPVAFAYNFQWEGIVESVCLTVAPESIPGTGAVLAGRMLRDSFERGDRSFVFAHHDREFGRTWQTSTQTSYRYTHFARMNPRAQVLRLNQLLKSWIVDDVSVEAPVLQPCETDADARPKLVVVG